MVVWYGTNEYNFEKLPNPPSFEPTRCAKCGAVIHLGADGYTISGNECWCEVCAEKEMEKTIARMESERGSRHPQKRGPKRKT